MSDKICDHTSVGMLVWDDGNLLLLERRKPPYGYAPPAGHVDSDVSYEVAAKRELTEEVGLTAISLKLVLEQNLDNPCRREGGTWHHWKVYEVAAKGEIQRSPEETKQVGWHSKGEVKLLASKTQQYLVGNITDEAWRQRPGLEIVWYEHFKSLGIL